VIRLDPARLKLHGREATESAIRRMVCSVKFEWLESLNELQLRGPDMPYHSADPHLQPSLAQFARGMRMSDIMAFRTSEAHFDLCFEDSWSGYFIADRIKGQAPIEDLILVHLDDHTDMMPTLLTRSAGAIHDCMLGTVFDPASREDWERSIHSGCVSIGNFITPLYYSKHRVHVRHLNNQGPVTARPVDVFRESLRYDLVPDLEFAGLRRAEALTQSGAGTYGVASDARSILADLPPGKIIVHFDLDYFVNDFNGNARAGDYRPDDSLAIAGREKLTRFFDAVKHLDRPIDRWIVGTSPGFCSALHWSWLLHEIDENIAIRQTR
jgi:hypothetical protein